MSDDHLKIVSFLVGIFGNTFPIIRGQIVRRINLAWLQQRKVRGLPRFHTVALKTRCSSSVHQRRPLHSLQRREWAS